MFKFYTLFIVLMFSSISCSQKRDFDLLDDSQDLIISLYSKNLFKYEKSRPYNGAILISRNGEKIYSNYLGFSDAETKQKIDSTNQFAIGSLSKQFTAVLTLLQVQKGNLNLNDDITKYLDFLDKEKYKNITIQQLLNHTSGINTLSSDIAFKSGTDFLYSNTAYNLLGKIIEKTSKENFSDLLIELFEDCDMENTTTADKYNSGNLVLGYDGIPNQNPVFIENILGHLKSDKIGIAAGGIISTPNDLVIWNEKLHNGKILDKDLYEKMINPSSIRNHPIFGTINYGFGIQISQENPSELFHSGYIKGFPSLNLYFPKQKISVIMLENISNDSAEFPFIFSYQIKIRDFIRSALNID